MKKIFLTAIFFSLIFSSCDFGGPFYATNKTQVDERSKSIAFLSGDNVPKITTQNSKYSFIVLTDTHFGTDNTDRQEKRFLLKFEELLSSSDETLRPQFIVNLGDTLNAGDKTRAAEFNKTRAAWIEKAKSVLGVGDYKVYSILGNHDLYNSGWENWQRNIWPHTSFYKFSVNASGAASGFSFYFLDSANGTLGEKQFKSLENALTFEATSPKIVFCHYPLFAGGQLYFAMCDTVERNKLISIYAKYNVKYVFEGHTHKYDTYDFKNFREVIVPSYVYEKKFALVTVDESNASVSYEILKY